jgi:hypothetical protein
MRKCSRFRRPPFAVRQGGPSASSTPQHGGPALACTAFFSRVVHHEKCPPSDVRRAAQPLSNVRAHATAMTELPRQSPQG